MQTLLATTNVASYFTSRVSTENRTFRFCLLWLIALVLCGVPHSLAATPEAYDKAKTDMDRLYKDARKSQWRAAWQEIAADFMTVYESEKDWNNRPAALYRSALALDELARRSAVRNDAQQAEKRYDLLVKRHKSSVLADDALYSMAKLRAEVFRDTDAALELLQKIRSAYTSGDMADDASKYAAKLRSDNEGVSTKVAEKTVGREQTKSPAAHADKASKPAPPAKPVKPLNLPVRTVLLDAGHGGRDPGTRHNDVVERTITLDLAKRVGAILAAHDLTVRYTRFSNDGMSLDERTDKVRTEKADIMISIHINANTSESVHGFETYYLDIARTSEASRLAAVENAMTGRAHTKIPVARLLGVQNQESRRLARSVQRETLEYLEGKKYATRDGGIKTAPFQVLRKSGVPGILIEAGYCTNVTEAKKLASPAYRAALARGIANGILEYAKRK